MHLAGHLDNFLHALTNHDVKGTPWRLKMGEQVVLQCRQRGLIQLFVRQTTALSREFDFWFHCVGGFGPICGPSVDLGPQSIKTFHYHPFTLFTRLCGEWTSSVAQVADLNSDRHPRCRAMVLLQLLSEDKKKKKLLSVDKDAQFKDIHDQACMHARHDLVDLNPHTTVRFACVRLLRSVTTPHASRHCDALRRTVTLATLLQIAQKLEIPTVVGHVVSQLDDRC